MRYSQYPQSPAFLAACDELGILVMDAISTILLKSGKNAGLVKIKATAEGLADGEMEIEIR